MTKQEEIKRFISQYLRGQFVSSEAPEDECDFEAEFILRYLDSQGVVVKVERELPNKRCLPTFDKPTREVTFTVPQWWDDISMVVALGQANQEEMLKAGYVAVEPLLR